MFIQQIVGWFRTLSPEVLTKGLRVGLTVVVGLFLVRVLAVVAQRYIMRKSTAQRQMIARKTISYAGFVLVLMAVLAELGVKLTALLGAAGIVGIAVGRHQAQDGDSVAVHGGFDGHPFAGQAGPDDQDI